MAKDKTLKYVVTMTGMQNPEGGEFEVGTTINLTEAQAAARVGKVVLKSEAGSPAPAANTKLVEVVTKQAGELEALTTANAEGKAQAEALVLVNAELTTQVETLTATNTAQADQVKRLTVDVATLTEAAKAK